MFTGIVEATGRIVRVEKNSTSGASIEIAVGRSDKAAVDLSDTKLGDSISVDGVCLTVTTLDVANGRASFDLGPETLAVTTLGALVVGSRVHLERAMKLGDRLGGHMVLGHVDGVGTLVSRRPEGDALLLRFEGPASVMRYCIHKGSICVDGTSLTINQVDDKGFEVGLIPHTLEMTKLGELAIGDRVNLEADVLAKYVEKLLTPPSNDVRKP